ncbi:hypothetical protein HT031_005605 [Scenedesmus sp. PABB004]|nr:hypothetical protein HT031_005605 [Scenedesmus sp. PABB004]
MCRFSLQRNVPGAGEAEVALPDDFDWFDAIEYVKCEEDGGELEPGSSSGSEAMLAPGGGELLGWELGHQQLPGAGAGAQQPAAACPMALGGGPGAPDILGAPLWAFAAPAGAWEAASPAAPAASPAASAPGGASNNAAGAAGGSQSTRREPSPTRPARRGARPPGRTGALPQSRALEMCRFSLQRNVPGAGEAEVALPDDFDWFDAIEYVKCEEDGGELEPGSSSGSEAMLAPGGGELLGWELGHQQLPGAGAGAQQPAAACPMALGGGPGAPDILGAPLWAFAAPAGAWEAASPAAPAASPAASAPGGASNNAAGAAGGSQSTRREPSPTRPARRGARPPGRTGALPQSRALEMCRFSLQRNVPGAGEAEVALPDDFDWFDAIEYVKCEEDGGELEPGSSSGSEAMLAPGGGELLGWELGHQQLPGAGAGAQQPAAACPMALGGGPGAPDILGAPLWAFAAPAGAWEAASPAAPAASPAASAPGGASNNAAGAAGGSQSTRREPSPTRPARRGARPPGRTGALPQSRALEMCRFSLQRNVPRAGEAEVALPDDFDWFDAIEYVKCEEDGGELEPGSSSGSEAMLAPGGGELLGWELGHQQLPGAGAGAQQPAAACPMALGGGPGAPDILGAPLWAFAAPAGAWEAASPAAPAASPAASAPGGASNNAAGAAGGSQSTRREPSPTRPARRGARPPGRTGALPQSRALEMCRFSLQRNVPGAGEAEVALPDDFDWFDAIEYVKCEEDGGELEPGSSSGSEAMLAPGGGELLGWELGHQQLPGAGAGAQQPAAACPMALGGGPGAPDILGAPLWAFAAPAGAWEAASPAAPAASPAASAPGGASNNAAGAAGGSQSTRREPPATRRAQRVTYFEPADDKVERVKQKRRESAQRSRARRNAYMGALEAENEGLKAQVAELRALVGSLQTYIAAGGAPHGGVMPVC